MVKAQKTITMTPHKSKLSKMDPGTQQAHLRLVDVAQHNVKHAQEEQAERAVDEDKALDQIRKRQLINFWKNLQKIMGNFRKVEIDSMHALPKKSLTS